MEDGQDPDIALISKYTIRTIEHDSLSSIGQTVEYLISRMQQQISKSIELEVPANESTTGDNQLRLMFYTLLPSHIQRRVFLHLLRDRSSWLRLRTLFGTPPYSFLHTNDDGVLRAAGISHVRIHMAYGQYHVPSYSQFGIAHFVDSIGREYRLILDVTTDEDPLPPLALRTVSSVRLVCRIKKISRGVRNVMMKTREGQHALSFPRIGEPLLLQYTTAIVRMMHLDKNILSDRFSVSVRNLKTTELKASTALLNVNVE